MTKVAIAFSTKDRVELSKQTVEPLLQPDKFDIYWTDGSDTPEGQELPLKYSGIKKVHHNVRGGPDAAIAFNIDMLLHHPTERYTHIGLVENDVLLHPDWFGPTMALFQRGSEERLAVGAASARAYEDRVLIQRDGYAVMHNLGAGMIVLNRHAAAVVLGWMRTTHTTENRKVFALASGMDIARYWAFRGSEHWLCMDWGFEKILAQHGLAALALTPACAEMVGQDPPLEQQGLRLVDKPQELLRADDKFIRLRDTLNAWREMEQVPPWRDAIFEDAYAQRTWFAHQLASLGAQWTGKWRLRWSQGYGPFAWAAEEEGATLTVPVFGPGEFMVSGGKSGGYVLAMDTASSYSIKPPLPPEAQNPTLHSIVVPGAVAYRELKLTALAAGVCCYGIRTKEPQPMQRRYNFRHKDLPSP